MPHVEVQPRRVPVFFPLRSDKAVRCFLLVPVRLEATSALVLVQVRENTCADYRAANTPKVFRVRPNGVVFLSSPCVGLSREVPLRRVGVTTVRPWPSAWHDCIT